MTKRLSPMEALFPERRFVGFNRREGRFVFFSIVADLLKPTDTVVDFGAGRGHQIESSTGHMRSLVHLRSRVAKVIGVDPDPVVLTNPYIDQAYVLDDQGRSAVEADSADAVIAYAVLEHVADPRACADEVFRILKPGGWFCGWTPNKWGYVGLGARLTPNRLHARLLMLMEPNGRREADVFPTLYRINTLRDVRHAFDDARFENFSFTFNGNPSYHFGQVWVARFWLLYMALMPGFFRQSVFVFVRKRA